jgi:hypothetical protein
MAVYRHFALAVLGSASSASFAAPRCETTIALNMSGPRPTIEMTLANGPPGKAVFDTGAMGTVIDVNYAQTVGLANEGSARPPFDRMPFPTKYRSTVHGLRLAGVSIEDAAVSVLPAPESGIIAVISPQLFSGRIVEVDLAAGQLRICPRGNIRELGKATPYTDGPFSLPAVAVTIGSTKLLAHVDSGSPFGLSFPTRFARQFSLEAPMVKVGAVQGPNGKSDLFRAKIKGTVRVGSVKLSNPEVSFTDVLPRPNVGSALLKQMVVIIDPQAKLTWTRAATPI